MTAADALLASAEGLTFDEARQMYQLDGAPVDERIVLSLLGSGQIVRVPWTNRHRRTEGAP